MYPAQQLSQHLVIQLELFRENYVDSIGEDDDEGLDALDEMIRLAYKNKEEVRLMSVCLSIKEKHDGMNCAVERAKLEISRDVYKELSDEKTRRLSAIRKALEEEI